MRIKNQRYVLINWVFKKSFLWVLLSILIIYFIMGLVFGILYYLLQELCDYKIVCNNICGNDLNLWDYLYFSFVTQATLGYGDFSAVNIGKLICPIQAILGIFIITLISPLMVVKLWAPKDSIIFANYAECYKFKYKSKITIINFGFRCVNTHKMKLNNVKAICYFCRTDPRDETYGNINIQINIFPKEIPYIGESVWYFHTIQQEEYDKCENKDKFEGLNKLINNSKDYRFKVIITGMYGSFPYSSVHVYELKDLINGLYKKVADEPDGTNKFNKEFHEINKKKQKDEEKKIKYK